MTRTRGRAAIFWTGWGAVAALIATATFLIAVVTNA